MSRPVTIFRLLTVAMIFGPTHAWGLDPYEKLDFRLFLGRMDGNETRDTLGGDSHRYTVGLGASAPIAWGGALEVNLEGWLTERSYTATLSTTAGTAESASFTAGSLTYGLRIRPEGRWRPYGMAALGLQTSRLSASVATTGTPIRLVEEITTTIAQVGGGIEYRFGRDLFSVDWRRWYGEGSFSAFRARDVDLGGDFIGIGLGHSW